MEDQKYDDEDAPYIISKCMENLMDVALPDALINSTISQQPQSKRQLPTLQTIMERKYEPKLLIILTFDLLGKLNKNKRP